MSFLSFYFFFSVYDFDNLYGAYKKARRGKRWKDAAIKFEINLIEAILLLQKQLRTRTYTLAPYNVFKVYEPKERLVMSNSYKDKVVQHSLCDNVLEPILTKTFILDNYASQVGKARTLVWTASNLYGAVLQAERHRRRLGAQM